jgi:fructan beta-fructosidase
MTCDLCIGLWRIAVVLITALGPALAQITPDDLAYSTEEVAGQQHYRQPLRPQFHYTPMQGHIGDATGLIYYAGEYHLFHMFDEWSQRRSSHKRWGHAVSTDLVHWTQLPAILDTLLDNSPGSGSGVVDWKDSSGLRVGAEKALLIFYTDYKRGTCMAYSRDRGRTWVRYANNPVIAGTEDARDPTVFWYTPDAQWRMVRYEKKGFAFYRSPDLVHWMWLSRVEGYYECPDLIRLPVLNSPGESRWVLIDGNGQYVIGVFDGTRFVPLSDKLTVEYGKALYAAQAWKRTPEGGSPTYQISWMRYPLIPRLSWIGQMSFPVELTLRSFPEGIRLCRNPIDELNNLRVAQQRWRDLEMGPGSTPLEISGDLLDIRAEIEPRGAERFGFTIHNHEISYSNDARILRVDGTEAPLKQASTVLRLRILVDRSSIEVFAGDGQVTISNVVLTEPVHRTVVLNADGKVRLVSLEVNQLESIWLGRR